MMEENIKTYYPLGQKTLFMFIFKKTGILFFLAVVLLVGLFFLQFVPKDYFDIALYVIFSYTALFLIVVILIFLIGWLQYIHYGIYIDQKMVKIKKGLLAEEISGVPYRYIHDVKIDRSIIDQLLGVSDIIITVSTPDDPGSVEKEHKIFLPSLEKNVAMEVQDTILKKAQVEQINVLGGQRVE